MVETETYLWTGGAASGSAIISFLLKRAIDALDSKINSLSNVSAINSTSISDVRFDLAKNYVSKDDFDKQMSAQLKPLQDDITDLKTGIAGMASDIKTLIRRRR